MTPEDKARQEIDAQLTASGWVVQDCKVADFAKDDSHAEDIVHLCREVFGKGNDFCKKITYRAKHPVTGKPVKGRRSSRSMKPFGRKSTLCFNLVNLRAIKDAN